MTRLLYEHVLNMQSISSQFTGILQCVNDAQIFLIDNVAEYYFMSEQRFNLSDFPNLAPPFGFMYFEYAQPRYYHDGKQLVESDYSGRQGVLFMSAEISDIEASPHVRKMKGFGAKWAIAIVEFCEYPKNTPHISPGAEIIYVDYRGRYVSPDPTSKTESTNFTEEWLTVDDELRDGFGSIRRPALLATSLMHCKNVKTVPRGKGTTPGKRNHNPCKFTYKVLDIEPMKQVLRTEGKSESVGLRRALHICRGHFKDYTEHGLFGRNKGIYWWDSAVRGNIDAGIVLKDYRVKI